MGLQQLLSDYWYVFVLIAVAILLYIYTKLDAYTKKQITKILNKKTLIFIGLGLGWYLWNRYGSEVTISNANRWMPMIILFYFLTTQFLEALKYQTPQLITPNFHGSFSKAPYEVDGFLIFAIDTINAGGLSLDHAKRIAVIRKETCELFARGGVSLANMGFCSKYELTNDVKQFIENNKYLKGAQEQIYYGWFDDLNRVDWDFEKLKDLEESDKAKEIYRKLKKELNVENPKVSTLYWLFRNTCKAHNKQTDILDGAVESIEKGVEHHKRVKDAYGVNDEPRHKSEGDEY